MIRKYFTFIIFLLFYGCASPFYLHDYQASFITNNINGLYISKSGNHTYYILELIDSIAYYEEYKVFKTTCYPEYSPGNKRFKPLIFKKSQDSIYTSNYFNFSISILNNKLIA